MPNTLNVSTGIFTADSNYIAPSYFQPATSETVNAERDRRMRSTITFQGKVYATDEASLARISGAATLAGFAIGAGAQPGNLLWHGGASPFAWIAEDNSINTMDALTMFSFGQTAAANETAHIFAARALKDMIPIPQDYTDNKWWP